MSWESWVDNLLAYQPVNVAAIYGLDGSVWAQSASCTATEDEIRALVGGLGAASAGDFSSFNFMGVRFMTLRLMDGEIDGKCKSDCITVVKSNQCVVLGASINSPNDPAGANGRVSLAVSKVKKALSDTGY